jgi:hypothetical protein
VLMPFTCFLFFLFGISVTSQRVRHELQPGVSRHGVIAYMAFLFEMLELFASHSQLCLFSYVNVCCCMNAALVASHSAR